ncbi:ACP phosphodiesterase [Psychromonas sp. PT13]|uniref:acyl carrier protein phosphodiesterase n=1 Tax=Psychromonas sp. PT13 TaxID=3439547 RepID=UPI003EB98A7A
MNFLAHLHIASHTKTSFTGNFLGDFVKGRPEGKFNADIVQGIQLHRFVDSYTDYHPLTKSLKLLFPSELRRYALIALDMFWDHCLAKHWHHFESSSLERFCHFAEQTIKAECRLETNELPSRFIHVSNQVWKNKWFEHYTLLKNTQFGLEKMSTRSERLAPLAMTGEILEKHYEILLEQFFILYPDVLQKTIEHTQLLVIKKEAR